MAKSTSTPAFNPFAQKATPNTKTAAKKSSRPQVTIKGAEFADTVAKFKKAKTDLANAKADLETAQGIIKDLGTTEFIRLYAENKRNPDSFDLLTEAKDPNDVLAVMIQPKDAYKILSPERAQELQEIYGEDVVVEETTFSFDPKILGDHAEALGKLIMSAKFLTPEEKVNLIKHNTTVSIKKGAIDEAMTTGKGDVEKFLREIDPTIAIK